MNDEQTIIAKENSPESNGDNEALKTFLDAVNKWMAYMDAHPKMAKKAFPKQLDLIITDGVFKAITLRDPEVTEPANSKYWKDNMPGQFWLLRNTFADQTGTYNILLEIPEWDGIHQYDISRASDSYIPHALASDPVVSGEDPSTQARRAAKGQELLELAEKLNRSTPVGPRLLHKLGILSIPKN